jgi:succinate-semialdehyde dehydrogenase/glutarate-semialdehyde dehydrogenase
MCRSECQAVDGFISERQSWGEHPMSLVNAGVHNARMVFINHPTWTACDLPFGGVKNSGYGRELTSLGIQEFVNKKLIRVSAIDSAI